MVQDVDRERKKRKKENWLTNPDSSLVTDDDSWFAIFWVSIFVVFQILWLLIFPVHLVVKQAHITNSFRRKSVETLIDLVYIANVFITPLIAIHWKKLDAEVLKRYKVEHLVKIKKISLLLANYADYHLLLDFLSRHVPLRSVPVWSDFLEIGLRLGCASCSHLIEPSIVAVESRVGRWHQVDERSRESGGFGVVVVR